MKGGSNLYIVNGMLFTDIQKKFYYNEYGFFYEGQELENYDFKGNYIQNVIINKFIVHYDKKTKEPYMCFNFRPVGFKKSYTFECNNRLGITYKSF